MGFRSAASQNPGAALPCLTRTTLSRSVQWRAVQSCNRQMQHARLLSTVSRASTKLAGGPRDHPPSSALADHTQTDDARPVRPVGRGFHTYFVTHLPSSSMRPDRALVPGPGHNLPRDASTPYTPGPKSAPAAMPFNMRGRDTTVVRIPLKSAKHHFGTATARGTRPYNEDTDQAGTIDMPAFARRPPMSLIHPENQKHAEVTPADSSFGDPQIFYFAVFDGHGGNQCSQFLKDELHGYIEEASFVLGLQSSLGKKKPGRRSVGDQLESDGPAAVEGTAEEAEVDQPNESRKPKPRLGQAQPGSNSDEPQALGEVKHAPAIQGSEPLPTRVRNMSAAVKKLQELVDEYRFTVAGYFRRFHPATFHLGPSDNSAAPQVSIETVLEYAFLRADLDFVVAQARKPDPDDATASEAPYNADEILGAPHTTPLGHQIGGRSRFKGGSTGSVALLSTPTPMPYWHPASHATLLVAHVGDTRIVLCETATGKPIPVTSDHHPTSPSESKRLRRYAPAGAMVSGDSFGEERIAGLANSRAFGDMRFKRVGVSAEPEVTRLDMSPAQYSFLVLCSDGVSSTLSDQEIVDVIKEARTPEQGARDVVNFATEVSKNGDNATCSVVRLGGWERRSEGGTGSLGTKEFRDARRAEALDPRSRKR
jgi:protein phosphatase PTC6